MDRLRIYGAKARFLSGGAAMADLVYLVIGLLFFGLMGAYAHACTRL